MTKQKTMEPTIYGHRVVVTPSAIDIHGIVNNAEYVRWMEDAAVAHSVAQGWGIDQYRTIGGTWKVRHHSIKYFLSALEGDALTVATHVRSFGRATLDRHYQICRADDLLVEATTTWVWVDLDSGRPKRIPESIVTAFA